jgi:phosphoserine phosphatase
LFVVSASPTTQVRYLATLLGADSETALRTYRPDSDRILPRPGRAWTCPYRQVASQLLKIGQSFQDSIK